MIKILKKIVKWTVIAIGAYFGACVVIGVALGLYEGLFGKPETTLEVVKTENVVKVAQVESMAVDTTEPQPTTKEAKKAAKEAEKAEKAAAKEAEKEAKRIAREKEKVRKEAEKRARLDNFFIEYTTTPDPDIETIAKKYDLRVNTNSEMSGVFRVTTYKITLPPTYTDSKTEENYIKFSDGKVYYHDMEHMILSDWSKDEGYTLIDYNNPALIYTDEAGRTTTRVPMPDAQSIINYEVPDMPNHLEDLFASLWDGMTKNDLMNLVDEYGLYHTSRGHFNYETIAYCSQATSNGDNSYITFHLEGDKLAYLTYHYYPTHTRCKAKANFYTSEYKFKPNGYELEYYADEQWTCTQYDSGKELIKQLHAL